MGVDVPAGREGAGAHVTHRGIAECRAFAERFVAEGVQFDVEDILVNGPPWRTRVAVRTKVFAPAPDGPDRYTNRAVAFIEVRWGRILRWEDYEDSERVAAWGPHQGALGVNRLRLGSPARWVQLLGVGHLGVGAVLVPQGDP